MGLFPFPPIENDWKWLYQLLPINYESKWPSKLMPGLYVIQIQIQAVWFVSCGSFVLKSAWVKESAWAKYLLKKGSDRIIDRYLTKGFVILYSNEKFIMQPLTLIWHNKTKKKRVSTVSINYLIRPLLSLSMLVIWPMQIFPY